MSMNSIDYCRGKFNIAHSEQHNIMLFIVNSLCNNLHLKLNVRNPCPRPRLFGTLSFFIFREGKHSYFRGSHVPLRTSEHTTT